MKNMKKLVEDDIEVSNKESFHIKKAFNEMYKRKQEKETKRVNRGDKDHNVLRRAN